jgi:hypothetical protein
VRARAAWIACAGLALFLPLSPASATQPIVETRSLRQQAVSDTSVEQLARAAEGAGFSSTNTGVLLGLGLMVAAIPAASGGILFAGYGVCAVGAVAGPAAGWARAGYPARAGVGSLVRAGLIGGCIAIPLGSRETRQSEYGGLAVAYAALTGLVLATFEAYLECDGIGTYVRRHGAGSGAVGLVPATSPSGVPGLALVAHFR